MLFDYFDFLSFLSPKKRTPAADSTPENTEGGDTDLPAFEGKSWVRDGSQSYQDAAYQYATTSQPPGALQPKAIIQAANLDDVVLALGYAADKQISVAVRSGGHHYVGASSTSGDNIQLDMSRFDELSYDPATNELRVGAGVLIYTLSDFMVEHGIFTTHGSCGFVGMGGHIQSGGLSCIRAHGLLCDYVHSFDIVLADGSKRTVTKDSQDELDKELYWGVLGGSPGTFGVVTSCVINPLKDADHPNSRSFAALHTFDSDLLERLMDVLCQFNDEADEIEADFDMTVVPFGSTGFFKGRDVDMDDGKGKHRQIPKPGAILVAVNWSNLGGADQHYDPNNKWVTLVREALRLSKPVPFLPSPLAHLIINDDKHLPLSKIFDAWIVQTRRSFNLPFFKANFIAKTYDLGARGFARWYTERVREITVAVPTSLPLPGGRRVAISMPELEGCHVSAQILPMGGKSSRLLLNGESNVNAASWRDGSTWISMEVFYEGEEGRKNAELWHQRILEEMVPKFCNGDRRLIWAPYPKTLSDCGLDKYQKEYFGPSPDTYPRLVELKRRVDPEGLFSASPFSLQAPDKSESPEKILAGAPVHADAGAES